MSEYNRELLRPGMTMGYRPSSLFGKIIVSKTWMNLSHVETYIGGGMSVAARWEGVNMYPVREDKYLCVVLEPTAPFDLDRAKQWFMTQACGLKYDLWGMRIFYRLIRRANPDRMWCSELCTEFYRAGGFEPFQSLLAADRVSPAQFLQTGALNVAWCSPDAYRATPRKR